MQLRRILREPSAAVACGLLALLVARPGRAAPGSDWLLGQDNLLYTDTDNVQVLTSQVAVARELDPDGGQVSARGLIDVVSAASVDVVSHATLRFDEVRVEGDLALSYAFDDVLPAVSYRISREPDYDSQGFSAGAQLRLGGADTVLAAHYGATFDRVGRSGSPDTQLSEALTTHSADLGVTQNLGPESLLRAVYTLTYQSGYLEKPYRFVPLFSREGLQQASDEGAELGLETFERYSLSARPPEEVPDRRARHALALRYLTYLPSLYASLRLDYRFYVDSFEVVANSAEAALYFQLGDDGRLQAFVRGYQQDGASFWQRTYVSDGQRVPRYRTLDRKLSPYWAATLGGRLEVEIKPLTFYLELGGTFTRFTDYLLLDDRFALISQLGLEWRL